MLNKLKRRFVLTAMLLVGLVILFVFIAVLALGYRTERQTIARSLENMLTPRESTPPTAPSTPSHEEEPPLVPDIDGRTELPYVFAYAVTVDEYGNILQEDAYGAGMDEETLEAAIAAALPRESSGGILHAIGLIYEKRQLGEKTRIAFTSVLRLFDSVKNTAIVTGGVCAVALLFFYLVTCLLANLAFKPTEEAWEKQKQFVADASHDLKTPLTVILANTDILASHAEPMQRQWIESTKEEAGRMRSLVEDLLELAASEDPSGSAEPCECDLGELTERTALQLEALAFERRISIDCAIASGIRTRIDENAYLRLLYILIDNAIKYSPEGEHVHVSLCGERTGIVLAVKNMGNPIPCDDLPHIFERFYRTDKARQVGGHGLGLAIAKNLAERLHGKISAESTRECGTTFRVVFQKGR